MAPVPSPRKDGVLLPSSDLYGVCYGVHAPCCIPDCTFRQIGVNIVEFTCQCSVEYGVGCRYPEGRGE